MEKKIKRPDTLKFQAVEWIMELMASGELKADEIYSANHFANVLGISRTPAREALLQLTSEGYFISLLGRGFKIRQFTDKEIMDFFETRTLIETYIIEHLGNLITDDFIQILEDHLQRMVECAGEEDIFRFIDADKTFHMSLVSLYENTQFVHIMNNIRNLITTMADKALSKPGRFSEVIAEHQLIIDQLKKKNLKKAARAMFNHIKATEKSVLNHHLS